VDQATDLGVSDRTLRRWRRRWQDDHLDVRARGRPPRHATRAERQAILALFHILGPHVGLPTLQCHFPAVARGELIELQRRWRYALHRRRKLLLYQLHWRRAGAVWAADHSHPPTAIDGHFSHLLLIRDLPSSYQLAALPTLGEDGESLRRLLDALVRWQGAPLVLKADNGSAFIAEETQDWAKRHGVLLLLSPPRTPKYNGAAEAGIGSIKTRAHYESVRHGRPGHWTCDDVEAAVQQANDTARPLGRWEPTPAEMWSQRVPIGERERRQFQRTYRLRYALECSQRGLPWSVEVQRGENSSIDRVAISQALIEHGYLAIRRRRISTPFSRRSLVRIR
jgi:transposase InsO family protein